MNDPDVIIAIRNLQSILNKAKAQMKIIADMDNRLNQLNCIEKAELKRLVNLCNQDLNNYSDIERYIDIIEYTTKKRTEGKLFLAGNGRYRLKAKCKEIKEFNCGSEIEVFIDDQNQDDYGWNFGRVEYDHGQRGFNGYYFCNSSGYDNHPLKPGMLAAIRP